MMDAQGTKLSILAKGGEEMYSNLEAEMARAQITRGNLANLLSVRYATIIDKLKGRYSFTLDEAFLIRNTYFPEVDIEYLFEKGGGVSGVGRGPQDRKHDHKFLR